MIVDPSGKPLTQLDQKAEAERLQLLFSTVMESFEKECASTDFLIVGVNLLTSYIFNGPMEGVNVRMEHTMQNLGKAIENARQVFIMNVKVNASLQKTDCCNDRHNYH